MAREQTDILLLLNHRDTIFLGAPAAKIAGVRAVINWQHETFRRYSLHRLTMLGRRIFHLLCIDRVVAVAKGHKEYIIEYEGVPRRKVEAIYNAVDTEKLISKLTVAEAKKRLDLPVDSLVVSSIAVLRPDKAHDVLLRAAQIVLDRFPRAFFLIVGDGPQKPALMELAAELGIQNAVRFLGFRLDIADILQAVDINVLSTKPEQETLSLAVIEAMAVGKPNICTDVGFMKEIITPGKNGFLTPVGDVRNLAQKIMTLLGDEKLRRDMGQAALQVIKEKLNVDTMVRSFENLFCRLAGK
ncbi:MAG: glycosyltransferase [Deltaproteobacteria bacterium]|nr:glycosyltransferase [Deltaproteobacteria bacterium]